jgi:manganese/iron transport system substrate-binding protein
MRDLFSQLAKTRWAAIVVGLGLLTSCNAPTATQNPAINNASSTTSGSNAGKIKVVVSSSVLCDLTQRIAEDSIDLKCLVKPGQDSHTYQVTPDDRKAIESANLIFYSGYNFEPAIIRLAQAAPSSITKVAVGELAVPKPLMGENHEHQQGDDHEAQAQAAPAAGAKPETAAAEADPHIWHNAQNGRAMVTTIQQQLTQVSPSNAQRYANNAKVIGDRLARLDNWIKGAIATIPPNSRKLITTHDALGYYGAAYNMPIEGALQGLSTDEQPTPTRVKALVDVVKAAQVPTIFAEVSVNPALIKTVAQDAKVKLAESELFADGLGASGSGAETYEQMLISNTTTIVTNLGGKITPPPT